VNEKPAHVC